MTLAVAHRLSFPSLTAHLVDVETTIRANDGALPSPLVLFMPVWTPGSYLVREYARHVEALACDPPASAVKIRKNAWRIDGAGGATAVTLRYRVYCNELSVRTNHVDESHAFLTGAAVFLGVEGHESVPASVHVAAPEGWRVATALPEKHGVFEARDFDTLVDCPFEIGRHREASFVAAGKAHRLAIWPHDGVSGPTLERWLGDLKSIVETEARIFTGARAELPYDDYLYIVHLSPRGRGGLEHMSSAALLASPGAFASREGYLDLLSLAAHETFHAWSVKRLRPEGLWPYRYQEESYTRLLWWFEGGTSYYDWRVLRLAKLCSPIEYLDHLAGEIAYLDATHGRHLASLEDASFDAWIKLYRPDENSANSTISYYRKGELVCALLDIEIRARSDGRATLDDVTAALWSDYGARGVPLPEDGMQAIFERVAGVPLGDLFDALIRSAGDIDYDATLARVGLRVERSARSEAPSASLGARIRSDGARTYVALVTRGGAAQRAGIDPGDELLSVAGRRPEGASLDGALAGRAAGDSIEVIVARDGRTLSKSVTLDPPRQDRVRIVAIADAPGASRAAFLAWLGDPHPSWAKPSTAASASGSGESE